MFLLRADQRIKTNSERLQSVDQQFFSDTKDVWLGFQSPIDQALKSFRRDNQAIENDFH